MHLHAVKTERSSLSHITNQDKNASNKTDVKKKKKKSDFSILKRKKNLHLHSQTPL
jgi:hypothetical protein